MEVGSIVGIVGSALGAAGTIVGAVLSRRNARDKHEISLAKVTLDALRQVTVHAETERKAFEAMREEREAVRAAEQHACEEKISTAIAEIRAECRKDRTFDRIEIAKLRSELRQTKDDVAAALRSSLP